MMRRLRTLVLIVTALAFAVIGGVAVASALLPTPSEPIGQEASRPAGTDFALGGTVADPDGGRPWTVRTYTSKTSWTCAQAGRTDGQAFGQLGSDGKVRPLDLPDLGSCADIDKDDFAIWVNHYPAGAGSDARAVIFGAVSADVTAVALTLDGASKELALTHGAFLDVVPEPSLAGAVLRVTLADGTTHDTRLRPVPTHPATTPADG
jgi:hypothetical protein